VSELDVVTFGEAMVLLLAEPGTPLESATVFRRSVAGAESNVAIGLTRLGHRTGWFGRVGDDSFGDVVLRALRAESVDVSRARRDGAPTGLLVRDCSATTPIEVLYFRSGSAGSRLDPDDVDAEYLGSARLLHVSGITAMLGDGPRRAVDRAIDIARGAGVPVSFDPNFRRRLATPEHTAEVLGPIAERADLLIGGHDEVDLLTAGRGAAALLEKGSRLVVTTKGAAGAEVTDGNSTWCRGALPVAVVDPVGAGDAFTAGFLSAWLRGRDPQQSLDEGVAVAACAVAVATDIDGLPTASRRDAMLAADTEARR
jgi:2-dehydro-3-deoxygluconokinase